MDFTACPKEEKPKNLNLWKCFGSGLKGNLMTWIVSLFFIQCRVSKDHSRFPGVSCKERRRSQVGGPSMARSCFSVRVTIPFVSISADPFRQWVFIFFGRCPGRPKVLSDRFG